MAAPPDGREGLLKGITVTVLSVWVLSVVVQIIDPSRQVPLTVNALAGTVVTALVTGVVVGRRNGNGRGNGDA